MAIVIGASVLSYRTYRNETETSDNLQTNLARPLFGLSLALYAMVMIGIQPVLQKMGLRFGAALTLYILYLLLTRPRFQFEGIHSEMGYYLIASVAWAFSPLIQIWALKYIPAVVLASLFRTGPLFTVIFTHFFLKGIEEINWKIASIALVIVLGAILVSSA